MSSSQFGDSRTAKHALITGGAGFIGSHLAETLLAQGYRVSVLDNLSTGRYLNVAALAHHPAFRFVQDSVTNQKVVDRLANECDVIFHLAAAVGVRLIVNDPVESIETNIMGTHNVLKAAARYSRRVLIASTSEIYGKSERVPFREEDDCVLGPTVTPRWSYSASKAIDEFLALGYHRKAGLPVVIFRLFNTIGPRQTGQYGMVVPRFLEQAMRAEPLTVYGDGRQSRCFCDVADVVRAIVALTECPQAVGEVFNIGSTAEVTIEELAHRVLKVVRDGTEKTYPDPRFGTHQPRTWPPESSLRFVPYDQVYGADFEDIRRRVPDISKIRELVGWEPRVSLDQTLRRMVAHLARPAPCEE